MVKKVIRHILLAVIVAFFYSVTGAQSLVMCVPIDMRNISAQDTAMVTWTFQHGDYDVKGYKVYIKSVFDNVLKEYITQDTFLLIPPDLEPTELDLMIHIVSLGHNNRDRVFPLHRKLIEARPSGLIFDAESCSKYITKLLKLKMYASAYNTFQKFKDKFELTYYSGFFRETNNYFYREGGVRITFRNELPVISSGGGDVSR